MCSSVFAKDIQRFGLEAEAESEFTCERARNVRAGWIDESSESPEIKLVRVVWVHTSDVCVHIIAVVGPIGQVEMPVP